MTPRLIGRLVDWLSGRGVRVDGARLTDADDFAVLHGLAFHRGWDEAEIEALLSQDAVSAFAARPRGLFRGRHPVGFLMMRRAADEAEVLTLVVRPGERRRGVGRALAEEGLRRLYARGVLAVFLEVEDSNAAAIGLYRSLGFADAGRRPRYYSGGGAPARAALVMRLDLR